MFLCKREAMIAEAHKVLSDDMESELAKYIKNLTDHFHGLIVVSNSENLLTNWHIETTVKK